MAPNLASWQRELLTPTNNRGNKRTSLAFFATGAFPGFLSYMRCVESLTLIYEFCMRYLSVFDYSCPLFKIRREVTQALSCCGIFTNTAYDIIMLTYSSPALDFSSDYTHFIIGN